MQLESPWALLLLLLLPFVYLAAHRYGAAPTLRVSTSAAFVTRGWRTRLLGLPLLLRLLGLVLLIVALARPRLGTERVEDRNDGVAIEMVLDRSGSMSEEFTATGGNRLDAAKQVFSDFVLGGGGLPGRPNDLIGLITFARYTDTICPLTLDHQAMPEFLKQVALAATENEDGTAIMDALNLAAARLHTAEKELKKRELLGDKEGDRIKSKIIILLTDGLDNRSRSAATAVIKNCKDWGIKIYTVGIGNPDGGQRYVSTPLGKIAIPTGSDIDVQLLTYLAKQTGGTFYLADTPGSLQEIYATIDKLEKSQIESTRYTDYAEKFMPLALAGLALLVLEALLRSTLLRTTP